MVKAENLFLKPCPFCGGEVELWKYREIIKCRFICKKCKVEIEFPRGYDSKTCTDKWNNRDRNRVKPIEIVPNDLSETMCMDEGPNQFKHVYYKPNCPHGYEDCVWDPMYIYSTYPKWYKSLYGEADPRTITCDNCKNGERYDDEDK